jgi:hypothetical protein
MHGAEHNNVSGVRHDPAFADRAAAEFPPNRERTANFIRASGKI